MDKETKRELKEQRALHREKIIDSVIDSLEEALDEDLGELDEIGENFEEKDEEAAPETEARKIRKGYAVLAGIMLVFSIIGVISTINFSKTFIGDIVDKKALKEEFEQFVLPVVINDPPAYDSVDNLQYSTIIVCSIWRIILSGDVEKFAGDMGRLAIPEVDVESSARSIFGTGLINHQNVSNFDMKFTYDENAKVYYVPENPTIHSYYPVVTEVENVGELYTVTIEYMAPSPIGAGYANQPVKTMIYTISRAKDQTTINSIKAGNIYNR